jgi:hypothetical protein
MAPSTASAPELQKKTTSAKLAAHSRRATRSASGISNRLETCQTFCACAVRAATRCGCAWPSALTATPEVHACEGRHQMRCHGEGPGAAHHIAQLKQNVPPLRAARWNILCRPGFLSTTRQYAEMDSFCTQIVHIREGLCGRTECESCARLSPYCSFFIVKYDISLRLTVFSPALVIACLLGSYALPGSKGDSHSENHPAPED